MLVFGQQRAELVQIKDLGLRRGKATELQTVGDGWNWGGGEYRGRLSPYFVNSDQ